MIRSLKTLIVGLAAAATLGVSATPASATTYHTRWDYLRFWDGHVDLAIPPRDLTLDGTYYWRGFGAHWAHPSTPAGTSRTVTLHGRYRWYDTLDAIYYGSYKHTSTIKNLATGGTVSMS